MKIRVLDNFRRIEVTSLITLVLMLAMMGSIFLPPYAAPARAYTTVEVIDVFKTVGTTTWTAPAGVTSVQVLVVAGGGGGGGATGGRVYTTGGGGGAGGVIFNPSYTVSHGQTITVTVGKGGSGGNGDALGSNGDNSVFGSIAATGGGGGGSGGNSASSTGRNGGSGGGGGGRTVTSTNYPGGTGVSGQGNNGGTGNSQAFSLLQIYTRVASGGGGGAGGAGGTASDYTPGSGGTGLYYGNIFGVNLGASGWFAGGGGGANYNNQGTANHGGGAGARNGVNSNNGYSGTANTGGGGGGAVGGILITGTGGNGGSGVVIIKYYVDYTIEVYDSVGSWTFTPPAGVTEVEYLVVGGGGGGGGIDSGDVAGAGGGGAGGFRSGTYSVTPLQPYTVLVGAGGSPGVYSIKGGSGESSSFATIIAAGGGGGASNPTPDDSGVAGGSGGGGRYNTAGLGGAGNTPATSPSQGNKGGTGSSSNYNAGGGGGAAAAGFNGASNKGGDGGSGTASSISGISITYAGGGAGGGYNYPGGSGGAGGGGSAPATRGAGIPGTDGLGGGGGGATGSSDGSAFSGGGGGSGIVIIRYSLTTTTTSLVSSVNPSEYGEPVTFTATVSPDTAIGTVQFKIDGNDFGSPVTLSGGSAISGAISSLSGGDHVVIAVYSGGGNHGPSQDEITQTVNPPMLSIEITAPADISSWTVSPAGGGENTRTGQLIINVTPDDASWTVTAQDMDATTSGYMTQWDGSSYGTSKLTNPLRVQGHSDISLPTGGVIASGTGDATVTVTFKQMVEWTDSPYDYRITVTFSGAIVP